MADNSSDTSSDTIDGFLVHGSVSADLHHHTVLVRTTDNVLDRDSERRQFLLAPSEALTLARNLLTAAYGAMDRQLWDAMAGECTTCGNSRFVTKVEPGHPNGHSIYCPDCVPRTRVPVPTMAGWAGPERAVLQ